MDGSKGRSLTSGAIDAGNLIMALANENEALSAMEKKLAAAVLDDVNFATEASITEMAERAGVSPPTVTRFCRRMGCASFSDFKLQLAKSTYVGIRYLKPELISNTPEQVAEDIVTKAQNALFETHRTIDLGAVNKAVDLLFEADMIHAFGSGGNSTMLVYELQNRLFRLGAQVAASNDQGMNMMLAAALERGSVVFGSSITGRNQELLACFETLQQRGIPTIALTRSNSPLSEIADVVLAIDLPEGKNIYRPTSVRYAALALIDILANLYAYKDREASARTLRRIKEQLVARRDGDDAEIMGD